MALINYQNLGCDNEMKMVNQHDFIKQKINSSLRSTLIDNLIFSVSLEGFLFVIDKKSGNIIRVTDIFKNFKSKKRSKIKPVGFILANDKVFLSLNNGRLVVAEILNGNVSDVIKIDNEKISRPYVLNNHMFIVRDNAIIKLN